MAELKKIHPMTKEAERALKEYLFDSYLRANIQHIRALDEVPTTQIIQNIISGITSTLEAKHTSVNDNPHNLDETHDIALLSVQRACQVITNQHAHIVPLGTNMQRFALLSNAVEQLLRQAPHYYPAVYTTEKLWTTDVDHIIAHETSHFAKAQELQWGAYAHLRFLVSSEGSFGCQPGVIVFPNNYLSPEDYVAQRNQIIAAVGEDLSDGDIEKLLFSHIGRS